MNNNDRAKISYLVLIAGRRNKDALLAALSEYGAKVVNILYGKGSAGGGHLLNMFGFIPERHKAVITCLTSEAKAEEILAMLADKFDFNSPNTGIAFTIPVDKIVY